MAKKKEKAPEEELVTTKTMTLKEKRAVAMKVMNKINADNGEVAVGFATDIAKPLRFIPTPSEELNRTLGGGWPIGRITEIFGSNSSGKTSIVLESIGEDMEANPENIWAWMESEESFDREYAEKVHGVDLDRLIYIDMAEEGAEKSLDRLESLMRTGILTGFAVNSVAGLTPKAEMEEDIGKQSIALQARMMSKLMRKWTGLIGKKDIVAIFVNQQRTDVGARFGDPNVTTGGRALSYYASVRFGMNSLKLQEGDAIKADDGLKLNARVAKNRCVYDNPYKKCEFYVLYGKGVDKLHEVIENAEASPHIRKAGSWYYYEETDGELINADRAIVKGKEVTDFPMKFQGSKKLRAFLEENKWFLDALKEEIRSNANKLVQYQDEEEMKEIEQLNKIEAEIAKEIEAASKPIPKGKAAKAKADEKSKAAPKSDKKPADKKEKKEPVASGKK